MNANPTVAWTDFSILVGTGQNNTAQLSIASVANLSNSSFAVLTNTFTVPVNGIYYMAIKGTSNGTSGSQYHYWDDFSITIPCTPTLNTPNVTISVNSASLCAGSVLTATAAGADTYTWNTGATSATFTDAPSLTTILTVGGTNTLTGCNRTTSLSIQVYPSPQLLVTAGTQSVCLGSGTILNAMGAATYT